jgi:hypothetical protein
MMASRFLRTLALPAALSLLSLAAHAQDETAAARVPLENYIKAQATGDGDLIRKAFHPDAKVVSVRDGKLQSLTAEEFAKRFSGKPAADEDKRVRRIESMEVVGNAGLGKIVLDYPNVTFVDYMQLLKIDGEWKIINKSFNATPKAPAK